MGTEKNLGYLRYCPGWLVSRTGSTVQNVIYRRGITEDSGAARDSSSPEYGPRSGYLKIGRGCIPAVPTRKKELVRSGGEGER